MHRYTLYRCDSLCTYNAEYYLPSLSRCVAVPSAHHRYSCGDHRCGCSASQRLPDVSQQKTLPLVPHTFSRRYGLTPKLPTHTHTHLPWGNLPSSQGGPAPRAHDPHTSQPPEPPRPRSFPRSKGLGGQTFAGAAAAAVPTEALQARPPPPRDGRRRAAGRRPPPPRKMAPGSGAPLARRRDGAGLERGGPPGGSGGE